jgi:tetratricopeptide (TPR) repeat protein
VCNFIVFYWARTSSYGYICCNLGNYTGAILYYDKALAVDPKDDYTLGNKGLALDETGNYTGCLLILLEGNNSWHFRELYWSYTIL